MDHANLMDIVGPVSLVLNAIVVYLQAKQTAAIAELKVYMFENFVHKTGKEKFNG